MSEFAVGLNAAENVRPDCFCRFRLYCANGIHFSFTFLCFEIFQIISSVPTLCPAEKRKSSLLNSSAVIGCFGCAFHRVCTCRLWWASKQTSPAAVPIAHSPKPLAIFSISLSTFRRATQLHFSPDLSYIRHWPSESPLMTRVSPSKTTWLIALLFAGSPSAILEPSCNDQTKQRPS